MFVIAVDTEIKDNSMESFTTVMMLIVKQRAIVRNLAVFFFLAVGFYIVNVRTVAQ